MSREDEAGRASARHSRDESELKPAPLEADDVPGVPGFSSWRGVYFFVLAWFAAMVIALTIFARYYV